MRFLILVLLIATVFTGCETAGSREYKPGQGWVPTPPPPPVPTP
jgi:hypothetical protein